MRGFNMILGDVKHCHNQCDIHDIVVNITVIQRDIQPSTFVIFELLPSNHLVLRGSQNGRPDFTIRKWPM